MSKIVELTREETDFLYKEFPTGRPLNFFSPLAYTDGFSIVALVANFLEKLGLCERVPRWVRKVCEKSHQDLRDWGILLPYATKSFLIGIGPTTDIITHGTLIKAKKRGGSERIAILLHKDQYWLLAAWNSTSGKPQKFPEIGTKINKPNKQKIMQLQKNYQEVLQKEKLKAETM